MADYIEYILFKNWFLRLFSIMKPEAFKIAEDVIFLQKNNNQDEISKISIRKYTSSTIQKEINDHVNQKAINIHTIDNIEVI